MLKCAFNSLNIIVFFLALIPCVIILVRFFWCFFLAYNELVLQRAVVIFGTERFAIWHSVSNYLNVICRRSYELNY